MPTQKQPMGLTGAATRLTSFIGEDERLHHDPGYTEIVHRAHRAGLARVSVMPRHRGVRQVLPRPSTRILSLSEDLPVAIVIIDTDEKTRAFLPELDQLVS